MKAAQSIIRKILGVLFLAALGAGGLSAQTPGTDARKEALQAMSPWLTELDSRDYAQTWSEAGKTFQKKVTLEEWVQSARAVHDAIGACEKRTFVSAYIDPSSPILVAQFESSFENLKHAVETVSFEKQADGTWRAAGYYVKPAS